MSALRADMITHPVDVTTEQQRPGRAVTASFGEPAQAPADATDMDEGA
jgi:hypothetical protein